MTAQDFIDHLQLQPHPEGGFYKETYRSSGIIPGAALQQGNFSGDRSYSTAIYFLLQQRDFSAFHRIKSDECWHFYAGDALLVHVIDRLGNYTCTRLGKDVEGGDTLQFVVPANAWFASEPAPGSAFALVGCTVAPGFAFDDFEMAEEKTLLQEFPQHLALVTRLCKPVVNR